LLWLIDSPAKGSGGSGTVVGGGGGAVVVVGASVVVVVAFSVVVVGFSVVVEASAVVVVSADASSVALTFLVSSELVNGAVTTASKTRPTTICAHNGQPRYFRHDRAGRPGRPDTGSFA
jgi:hypothetical protein